jgi:predicted phosphodiesterase
MRRPALVLGLVAAPIVLVAACGDGKSSKVPVDDASTPVAFSYTPTGCSYSVTPPASRAFIDTALDDGTAALPSKAAPLRVRIGLGGNLDSSKPGYADPSTTAAFTWETEEYSKAAKIRFGTTANDLKEVRGGFSWTTPPPVVGLSTGKSNYMHEVHVCGLTPATTYYYQVGGGPAGSEVWSATQSFTTVPQTGKVVVGVLGDARDKVATWQLVQGRMKDAGVALQLFSGDVVLAGSLESLYTQWLDAIWKDPGDQTKFWTLGQQMMVAIAGNHENEAAQFYGNFAIPGEGQWAEQYASFDVGNTHFVMIDDQPIATQEGGDASKAILAWLDADLARANANRTKVPFIVAISHRAIFSTSLHSTDGDVLLTRKLLTPIFDKYAVDLVFNGHDHEYERSKPLKAGNPPSGAPVVGAGTRYVVCAGAGADPYAVGSAQVDYREKATAFGGSTPYIGTYGLLELSGNTLTLHAYGLKAAGGGVSGDDEIDTVQLTH